MLLLLLFLLLFLLLLTASIENWVKSYNLLKYLLFYLQQGSANQPLINREIAVGVVNDCYCLLFMISLLFFCSSID